VVHATRLYLSAHPEHAERNVRFDVVALDADRLQWLQAAFDAEN
jgi:putative endonuclease